MNALWMRQPERGSALLLRFMAWLTRRLGASTGNLLLYPIALYFLVFGPRARAASHAYLHRALGRPPGIADMFRHHLVFAQTIMDRFLLLTGRLDAYAIDIEGREALDAVLAKGRGCILLGAHFGSFEVLRAIAGPDCPAPVRVMMYEDNASRLHGLLAAINPAAQASVIPLGSPEATLRAKEALDAGEMVGILGDRLVAGGKVLKVDFLGAPAIFPAGPMVLAGVLQVPVVLFFGIHVGIRRYAIQFELLADRITSARASRDADLAVWVQRYARADEARCRRHPFNWFNFYDFWHGGEAPQPGPARGVGMLSERSPAA